MAQLSQSTGARGPVGLYSQGKPGHGVGGNQNCCPATSISWGARCADGGDTCQSLWQLSRYLKKDGFVYLTFFLPLREREELPGGRRGL